MSRASRARRYALMGIVMWGAILASFGCDRNTSPYVPGEEPREPDLSRIFPASPDEDPRVETGGGQRVSAAQANSRTGRAADTMITGEVQLPPEFADRAPRSATLFIIARPAGVAGGPPLAVLRLTQPTFPQAFELSQANVMIPSLSFEGQMDVTARLDGDGNAMTRDPGDLSAMSASSKSPGDSGVVLRLDQVQP